MKKFFTLVVLTLGLVACSSDHTTYVPKYDDSDLQRRVLLLEQTVALQGQSIVTNAEKIAEEKEMRASEISRLEALITALQSDHGATQEQLDELESLVSSLNASNLPGIAEAMAELQAQIDALEPTVNNTYISNEFTFIGFLHNTYTTIVQQVADLTSINQQLEDLQEALHNSNENIEELEDRIDELEDVVAQLQQSQNSSSVQLAFVSTSNRQNGNNNNASIDVTFKNTSNITLTSFKVTVVSSSSSTDLRSGSSLVSPGGNLVSYSNSSKTLTFLVTQSGGIAPNANVKVRVLMDDLNGNDTLNFTAQAL